MTQASKVPLVYLAPQEQRELPALLVFLVYCELQVVQELPVYQDKRAVQE